MNIQTKVEFAHLDSSDEKTVGEGAFELVPITVRGRDKVLAQLFIDGDLCASAELPRPKLKVRKGKAADEIDKYRHKYEVHVLSWGNQEIELGPTGAKAAEKIFRMLGLWE